MSYCFELYRVSILPHILVLFVLSVYNASKNYSKCTYLVHSHKMKTGKQKLLQIIFGIFVSLFFLYLTFSEVNFEEISLSLHELDFSFIFISLLLVLVSLLIRSIRWAWILNPVVKIYQRDLFPISSIGIAAITILPLRLGEIVRPFLLTKAKDFSFSLALASIVLERLIDSFMLAGLLSIILIFAPLPPIVITAGKILFLSVLIIFSVLVAVYVNQEKTKLLMQKLLMYLPDNIKNTLITIFDKFFEGMSILSTPSEILKIISVSIILWLIYGLIAFNMFFFHNFDLPLIAAFSVVLITFLASSLPAAPGFLGTFQYGCFLALTSYGINSDDAAFFSITYYFVMIGMNIFVGLFFFLRSPIRLFDIRGS